MLPVGSLVHFVPPRLDGPRRAAVASASWIDGASYEVAFEGIGDRTMADELVGSHCLILRSDAADLLQQEAAGSLAGFSFIADGAELGSVEALRDNPGQQLLEVRRHDNGQLLLVPFVDEFILDIDDEDRAIEASLPAGLLEL